MDALTHAWCYGPGLFAAGFLLARWIYHRQPAAAIPGPDPSVSESAIDDALRAGDYIGAIRLHRRRHASDLRTARQAVDARRDALGLAR